MHTVELLLDDRLEAGVRALWRRLHEAGLPSLATHTHPTNRPHLTLLTAASLTGLPRLPLPMEARLGPARMLGRALVLEVPPADRLRDLQAQVWSALPGPDRWPGPRDWVPHVSLALKVPTDRHEAALRLFADVPPLRGHFTAVRSYDTETRTVTPDCVDSCVEFSGEVTLPAVDRRPHHRGGSPWSWRAPPTRPHCNGSPAGSVSNCTHEAFWRRTGSSRPSSAST